MKHNAKGAVIDRYTHWDWKPLCDAVACLSYSPHSGEGSAPEPTADRAIPAERLAPLYDASYDASSETAQNMLVYGGGAGNRIPGGPGSRRASAATPPRKAARLRACGALGLGPLRTRTECA